MGSLSESQRRNTIDYLNSKTEIPLRQQFRIPPVTYLTIANSEYIGGLEIAHVLADVTLKMDTLVTQIVTLSAAKGLLRGRFFSHFAPSELSCRLPSAPQSMKIVIYHCHSLA